jgi:hypothetical protein
MLLAVWDRGNFSGTLRQFHQAILAIMPSSQTPNYFTVGAPDDVFTNARPLTIVAFDQKATATGGQPPGPSKRPEVIGPPECSRIQDEGPTFQIKLGDNPYYKFEMTSDWSCFSNQAMRTSDNFYASWDDPDPAVPARYTSPTYHLPRYAWDSLKVNDKLYYRVGTTKSADPDRWDNYLASTTDGDAAQAPSMNIKGADTKAPPQRSAMVVAY